MPEALCSDSRGLFTLRSGTLVHLGFSKVAKQIGDNQVLHCWPEMVGKWEK